MESSDDDEEDLGVEEELLRLQAALGIHYRKVTVSKDEDAAGDADTDADADADADGEGDLPSTQWEDVLPAATAAAAAEEQAAGVSPATAPELLVGRASALDVHAHMARLPPEDQQRCALRQSLEENSGLQRRLRSMLESLTRAQQKNGDLIVAVKSMHLQRKLGSVNKFTGSMAAGASRFWRAPGGASPALNADAVQLLPVFDYLPHTFEKRPWPEDEALRAPEVVVGVVKSAELDRKLRELRQSGTCTREQISAATADSNQLSATEVERRVADFREEQWAAVAAGMPGRSAGDCRMAWCRGMAAARGPWTPAEDAAIRRSAKWVDTALELGTGRLAGECLARYQQQLAQTGLSSWSGVQDAALLAAMGRHGKNWKAVAADLGGSCTPQQAMHRATKRGVGTQIRKGTWDPTEDEALLQAVAEHGQKWALVAAGVPSRTDVQCRERFKNVLDPQLNSNPWTEEEDVRLLELTAGYSERGAPVAWSNVAAQLSGRTDSNAKRRHQSLMKGLPIGGSGLKAGRKRLGVNLKRKPVRKRKPKAEIASDDSEGNRAYDPQSVSRPRRVTAAYEPGTTSRSRSGPKCRAPPPLPAQTDLATMPACK